MERFKSSLNYIFDKLTKKQTLLGIVGVIATLSLIAVYVDARSNFLAVHFFDVGQGDAIFIEMPDGRQILIDGGPDGKVVEKLSEVMPFWDRSIDMVIATHADADHLVGIIPVLENYDVGMIVWNGVESDTETFKRWKKLVKKEEADVMIGERGMRFILSDGAFFEILHPYVTNRGLVTSKEGQNDYALVVRFVYGEDSFLFTGDIERQSEYAIISKVDHIESDVLKVGHHGSKTSSSALFLQKVKPKIAVISVGRHNSYGHPHAAILRRLKNNAIQIRRTDEEGDITLLSNGDSF